MPLPGGETDDILDKKKEINDMKKIEKLTPEQIAKFPEWVDRYVKLGLSTEPADFEKASAAALRAYELLKLRKPMIVLRVGSPYACAVGGALAFWMLRQLKVTSLVQVWDQVGDQVWDQVGDQVGDQVWAQVRDQVGDQVWAQVRDQVRDQVRAKVWDQVWAQVRAKVWDQVWAQVRAQVGDQVWDQVGAKVWDQVRDQVGEFSKQGVSNDYGGNLWHAGWVSFVTFMRDVVGIDIHQKFSIEEDLSASCGWVWWHQNVLAISDRPRLINRDEQGRLHSELGPAIAYRDGWELHFWHGVKVPAHWIDDRVNLSPEEVIKADNVELRAAGCAIVGFPKMLSVLKARVINDSGSPTIGQLIELDLPGLSEPGRFLKAECPRNGTILEGVPRISDIDNLPIDTAIAAQAWRIGDPQSEYTHPPRRT
jgi:hypothetical protein